MYHKNFFFLILSIFIIVIIIFYDNKIEKNTTPLNLNNTHICANDSMIILDYKGPKAQIIWKDNSRSYYCEVREAFYESTNKTRIKNIKYFFVQDFSDVEWDSYKDKWMLAQDAYYVIDSNMNGAMGLTYVPFSDINAAKKFHINYGGKLLDYNDITSTTLTDSSILLKNRIIF
ncbi:MAG TPA: nitrous oxide reductase accessory protein NosL [Candidatus Azoamicus sp. OHIO2]